MATYEYDNLTSGDSPYSSLSEYRRYECRKGWNQYKSMQAAFKVDGPFVYFKSYAFVCFAWNRDTNTMYVDVNCLRKSRTTNRQLSRFLSEWVGIGFGTYHLQQAISAYESNGDAYIVDGMYTAQYDVMSYMLIIVSDDLAYQIGEVISC